MGSFTSLVGGSPTRGAPTAGSTTPLTAISATHHRRHRRLRRQPRRRPRRRTSSPPTSSAPLWPLWPYPTPPPAPPVAPPSQQLLAARRKAWQQPIITLLSSLARARAQLRPGVLAVCLVELWGSRQNTTSSTRCTGASRRRISTDYNTGSPSRANRATRAHGRCPPRSRAPPPRAHAHPRLAAPLRLLLPYTRLCAPPPRRASLAAGYSLRSARAPRLPSRV